MKSAILAAVALSLCFGTSSCQNQKYFKDGRDPRKERLEDRRDRREMKKAEGEDPALKQAWGEFWGVGKYKKPKDNVWNW